MRLSLVCNLVRSSGAVVALLCVSGASSISFAQATTPKVATPDEIAAFFKSQHKLVLTFEGYSGAGYEDNASMLKQAERILRKYNPKKTIVNIGATPDGIGAVYEIAKRKGFVTSGIVSTQAQKNNVPLSPYVDHAFYVEDESWGGFLKGTKALSPTSEAMIKNSDVVIGIGGGEVARDELATAKALGKRVQFIPADMNHQKVRESARKKNLPEPTDFRGAASSVF